LPQSGIMRSSEVASSTHVATWATARVLVIVMQLIAIEKNVELFAEDLGGFGGTTLLER
jgi:hypothetical protein